MKRLDDEQLAALTAAYDSAFNETPNAADASAFMETRAALHELIATRPVVEAALALRDITLRAEGALTPAECNRQIVDNANAFRVLFDAVDRARAALAAKEGTK